MYTIVYYSDMIRYSIYIYIEDTLWIYKPTGFNIGEIDTAIYIWYVKVGIRRGDFLPGKKAKNIMGDMIINVFLKLGYTVGKLMIKEWIQGKAIFKYTDMVFSWNKIIDSAGYSHYIMYMYMYIQYTLYCIDC